MTVGLGVAAGVQGVATLDTRDQIERAVADGDHANAKALYDRGRGQQLRTNLLFGATAAAGVVTVVLAVALNRAGEPAPRTELAIAPGDGGATLVYGGRF